MARPALADLVGAVHQPKRRFGHALQRLGVPAGERQAVQLQGGGWGEPIHPPGADKRLHGERAQPVGGVGVEPTDVRSQQGGQADRGSVTLDPVFVPLEDPERDQALNDRRRSRHLQRCSQRGDDVIGHGFAEDAGGLGQGALWPGQPLQQGVQEHGVVELDQRALFYTSEILGIQLVERDVGVRRRPGGEFEQAVGQARVAAAQPQAALSARRVNLGASGQPLPRPSRTAPFAPGSSGCALTAGAVQPDWRAQGCLPHL